MSKTRPLAALMPHVKSAVPMLLFVALVCADFEIDFPSLYSDFMIVP